MAKPLHQDYGQFFRLGDPNLNLHGLQGSVGLSPLGHGKGYVVDCCLKVLEIMMGRVIYLEVGQSLCLRAFCLDLFRVAVCILPWDSSPLGICLMCFPWTVIKKKMQVHRCIFGVEIFAPPKTNSKSTWNTGVGLDEFPFGAKVLSHGHQSRTWRDTISF